MRMTYRKAGVDIGAGERAVELMRESVRASQGPQVITGLSDFAGLFAFDAPAYTDPVLVSSTDSVGTKLKIAFALDKHDTVGQDLVAMCVDDIVPLGARPLFMLDYIGCHTLQPERIAAIVSGVARACRIAGCALIAGETAELSDLYHEGEYDLAGFAVGAVDRARIIDGSRVADGDVLVGLASSGLHSNGYTLVRKVLLEQARLDLERHVDEFGRTLGEELLEPTRVYASALVPLFAGVDVHGVAHVTGGGVPRNVQRIIPNGLSARIDASSWPRPPVFDFVQRHGEIEQAEMYRTFNMGLGMVLALPPAAVDRAVAMLSGVGERALIVGHVERGAPPVALT